MRKRLFRALALVACVWLAGAAASAFASYAGPGQDNKPKQEQGKDKDKKQEGPKLSQDEAKAANKINEAKDAPGKLAVGSEFVKKYPKSEVRRQVAEHVASHVAAVPDHAQRATLAEQYVAAFNAPGEADLVTEVLLDSYLKTNRAADAFRVAGPWLESHPDDVLSRASLAFAATQALLAGNDAFAQQGRQYGTQAIALLEADKRPANYTDAQWTEYKNSWLPLLNYTGAIIATKAGDAAGARKLLENAAALKSTEPQVYSMLGNYANDEYEAQARQYQATAAGPARDEALQKALATLDRVIEYYAQAVALSTDRPEYQAMRAQLLANLESYYKYRHKNSTEGLQQLIDKYKRQ